MNINCQPPLQFVYFSTDTHIPWISHNTLRDRLFKNGVAIRKKVYCKTQSGYMDKTVKKLLTGCQKSASSLKMDLDGELVVERN